MKTLQLASASVELELGNGWLLDLFESQSGNLHLVGICSPSLENQTVLDNPDDSCLTGPHVQALGEAESIGGRGKLHPVDDLNQEPNGTCRLCRWNIYLLPSGFCRMVLLTPDLDILLLLR